MKTAQTHSTQKCMIRSKIEKGVDRNKEQNVGYYGARRRQAMTNKLRWTKQRGLIIKTNECLRERRK
jgi:hypothetical protein